MQTKFTVNSVDFKKLMLDIKKISKQSMKIITKISVQPNMIEFQFIGIIRYLEAETETYCDVLIPFNILLGIAKTNTHPSLTLIIKDGEVNFYGTTIANPTIKIQSLFSNKETELPMNPVARDILRLRSQYDEQKLLEFNVFKQVEKEEEILKQKLFEVSVLLNPYGVTHKEIEALVNSKLQ